VFDAHAGVCAAHNGAPWNFRGLRADRAADGAAFALL
jgi:hypothetical protein